MVDVESLHGLVRGRGGEVSSHYYCWLDVAHIPTQCTIKVPPACDERVRAYAASGDHVQPAFVAFDPPVVSYCRAMYTGE